VRAAVDTFESFERWLGQCRVLNPVRIS